MPDHAFWRPGPDTVAMATPDARKLLVSDADGHLHVIPRNTPPAQLAAAAGRLFVCLRSGQVICVAAP